MPDSKTVSAPLRPEDNPILQGNFAPVKEQLTVESLKVSGVIPKEINGVLLRNGPNPIEPGDNHHWFSGDAMLHGVEIKKGKALCYRNRWIRTTSLEEKTGLAAAAISPNQPLVQASSNVNVIQHAGHILALPEVGLPYEVDSELNTLGHYDFNEKLSSNMTAHPKIDGATGEFIFFGYDFFAPFLRYHVANAKGEIIHSIELDMPEAVMMHDFGVSATRVVFMDLPVVFDLEIAMSAGMPFRWSEDHQARLGIVPRMGKATDIVWINIDPCYVYHTVNAYDDGDKIVMNVIRYYNSFVNGEVFSGDITELVRWTIDPSAGTVNSEVISDIPQEFPVVNPKVECHRHRYGYSISLKPQGNNMSFSGLLKQDFQTGELHRHELGEGREAGEGIFVAKENAEAEDDGYVLSVVYDNTTNTSNVVIVDAQNFSAPPLATIHLPVRVPFGFHGCFASYQPKFGSEI